MECRAAQPSTAGGGALAIASRGPGAQCGPSMMPVQRCDLPSTALLLRHQQSGAYADCYATDIGRLVTHAEFVEAFYTTGLFKVERFILRWLAAKPSSDAQARQLAAGDRDTFAAWQVEGRAPDQLMLADFSGRTRSWLMVEPAAGAAAAGTRLYFGSAVVPRRRSDGGRPRMGFIFAALLGFHKLYSRSLLRAARARLSR